MNKFFNIVASSVLGIFLCPLMAQADVSVVRDGSNYVVDVGETHYVIHDSSTDADLNIPSGVQLHDKAIAIPKSNPGIQFLPCAEERQKVKESCIDEYTADCGSAQLELFQCEAINNMGQKEPPHGYPGN